MLRPHQNCSWSADQACCAYLNAIDGWVAAHLMDNSSGVEPRLVISYILEDPRNGLGTTLGVAKHRVR